MHRRLEMRQRELRARRRASGWSSTTSIGPLGTRHLLVLRRRLVVALVEVRRQERERRRRATPGRRCRQSVRAAASRGRRARTPSAGSLSLGALHRRRRSPRCWAAACRRPRRSSGACASRGRRGWAGRRRARLGLRCVESTPPKARSYEIGIVRERPGGDALMPVTTGLPRRGRRPRRRPSPRPTRKPTAQPRGRPALGRMGAADQQHVARVLARREVDLVHRGAKPGSPVKVSAMTSGTCSSCRRTGSPGFGQHEGALDHDHQQLAAARLQAHVVAGDHAGGVDQFHRAAIARQLSCTDPPLMRLTPVERLEHVGALDQHLAGLRERDAGLAAAQHQLLLAR